MSTVAASTPTFPNPQIDGQINQAAAMDFADGNTTRRQANVRLSEGTSLIIERERSSAAASTRRGEYSAEQLSQLYGVEAADTLLSGGNSNLPPEILGGNEVQGQPNLNPLTPNPIKPVA